MSDHAYRVGQEVLVFQQHLASGTPGRIESIRRSLLDIRYDGPGGRSETFRVSDQRWNNRDFPGQKHFRTLDQVEEENRYGRAVDVLSRHGLRQDFQSRLPVEKLEAIGRLLEGS